MHGPRAIASEPSEEERAATQNTPETPESLLAEAQQLWRNGRLAEAESAFNNAFAKCPDDMSIRRHFARVRMRQGRPTDALGLLSPLVNSGALHPGEIDPFVLTVRRLKDFTIARPQIRAVWGRHKASRSLTELYVESCLRSLDLAGAAMALREYSAKCPQDRSFEDLMAAVKAGDWAALTRHFYLAQNFAAAAILARHSITVSLQKPIIAQMLARSLVHIGKWAEAGEALALYRALSGPVDEEPWSAEVRELADPKSYSQSLIERFSLHDQTWIFVAHIPTGDAFYFFSLMKAFKEQQRKLGAVDHVTVLIPPRHRGIVQLFANDIDRVELLEHCNFRAVWSTGAQVRPGVPLLASTVLLQNPDRSYRTLLPKSIVQFSDWLKFTLGLPGSAPLSAPTVTAEARDSALKFMRDNGMPRGSSVIFAPWARNMPLLPPDVWLGLASRLKAEGHTPFLNVGPEGPTSELVSLQPISFGHDIAIPLVEEAGWVIANRSGFADIVAPARARVTVTYARSLRDQDKPWPYRDRWVLNHFSVPGRKLEEVECFVDERPDRTIERILSAEGARITDERHFLSTV